MDRERGKGVSTSHPVSTTGEAGPRADAPSPPHGGSSRDEGRGPQRRSQMRLARRLEEVAQAVGGGYCRLQMPLRLALGVRGIVAGHRLGALEGGGYLPPSSNASLPPPPLSITKQWPAVDPDIGPLQISFTSSSPATASRSALCWALIWWRGGGRGGASQNPEPRGGGPPAPTTCVVAMASVYAGHKRSPSRGIMRSPRRFIIRHDPEALSPCHRPPDAAALALQVGQDTAGVCARVAAVAVTGPVRQRHRSCCRSSQNVSFRHRIASPKEGPLEGPTPNAMPSPIRSEPRGAPSAQCAHSATIWACGRTRDPYFEILWAP